MNEILKQWREKLRQLEVRLQALAYRLGTEEAAPAVVDHLEKCMLEVRELRDEVDLVIHD